MHTMCMELDTDLNEALTLFNLKKCARNEIKKIKKLKKNQTQIHNPRISK